MASLVQKNGITYVQRNDGSLAKANVGGSSGNVVKYNQSSDSKSAVKGNVSAQNTPSVKEKITQKSTNIPPSIPKIFSDTPYSSSGMSVYIPNSNKNIPNSNKKSSNMDKLKAGYFWLDTNVFHGLLPAGDTPADVYSNKVVDFLSIPNKIKLGMSSSDAETSTTQAHYEKIISDMTREIQKEKEKQDIFKKSWYEQLGFFKSDAEKSFQDARTEQQAELERLRQAQSYFNEMAQRVPQVASSLAELEEAKAQYPNIEPILSSIQTTATQSFWDKYKGYLGIGIVGLIAFMLIKKK